MNHNRAALLTSLQFLQSNLAKEKLREEFQKGAAHGLRFAEKQIRENKAAFFAGTTARVRHETRTPAGKKKIKAKGASNARSNGKVRTNNVMISELPKCLQKLYKKEAK